MSGIIIGSNTRPTPIKAKFMSGFNLGVRHSRRHDPMSIADRGEKTHEFLAGYDIGILWVANGRSPEPWETLQKINETWASYQNGGRS